MLIENGDILRFDESGASVAGKAPAGRVLIDASGSGEVVDEVLRDRRHLAEDGLIVPVVAINKQTGEIGRGPRCREPRSRAGCGQRRAAARWRRSSLATSFRERVLKNGPIRASSKKRSASSYGVSSENGRGAGRSSSRSSWRSSVAGSTVSRRVSEFAGVALFAAALIWLIALATYEPTDPVWFFSAGSGATPRELRGTCRRLPRRAVVSAAGYASYLLPAAMVILGWHYFWCRSMDAAVHASSSEQACSSPASARF